MTLQGVEIISQASRVEAENEASSDDEKSLPGDSAASDNDDVSDKSSVASFMVDLLVIIEWSFCVLFKLETY